jgi:hypothetical protein
MGGTVYSSYSLSPPHMYSLEKSVRLLMSQLCWPGEGGRPLGLPEDPKDPVRPVGSLNCAVFSPENSGEIAAVLIK